MNDNKDNYISITNRNVLEVKGVTDVKSYDSEKIVFAFSDDDLILTGKDFYIKKIDVENKTATVNGVIISLTFSNSSNRSGKSFLASLFR